MDRHQFSRSIRCKITLTIFLLAFLTICNSCNADNECVSPATCDLTYSLCYCPDYALNCKYQLQELPVLLVSNIRSYVLLKSEPNQNLQYELTLSIQPTNPTSYTLSLYIDDGYGGTFKNLGEYTFTQNPLKVKSDIINLGYQSNNIYPEQLILGIISSAPLTVSINYTYSIVNQSNIFLILGYVGGGLFVVFCIIALVMFCRKRMVQRNLESNRQTQENKQYNISHFQQLMPATLISTRVKLDAQVCSICLQQYDLNSCIRATVCGHFFHQSCLDVWCLKNLSCPMCRTEFSRENILKLKQQMTQNENNTSWVMNTLNNEEEQAQMQIEASYSQKCSKKEMKENLLEPINQML